MSDFKAVKIDSIPLNAVKLINKDWMLITPGNAESHNTMTASWGGLGELWNKAVCYCVIRPGRYTYEIMEKSGYFSICFFDEAHRKALNYCGSKSGRSEDKIKAAGLTPVEGENGTVYFKEARMVLICKKIYFQDLNPENFLDPDIIKNYPEKDYHRMYVGEILSCLMRE